MAQEQRLSVNNSFGQLSIAAAASDLTLSSANFASLPAISTGTQYLPLVLGDPSLGPTAYEVVWVTAHTASATSVTVQRGKEGTTAQAWPSQSAWICGPTIRDGLIVSTRAGLPSDAHYGMRAWVSNEDVGVIKTPTGWTADVGVAAPADIGPDRDGVNPGNGYFLSVRAGHTGQITPSGDGEVTIVYRTPFLYNTVAASVVNADNTLFVGFVTVIDEFHWGCIVKVASNTLAHHQTPVKLQYIAVGY